MIARTTTKLNNSSFESIESKVAKRKVHDPRMSIMKGITMAQRSPLSRDTCLKAKNRIRTIEPRVMRAIVRRMSMRPIPRECGRNSVIYTGIFSTLSIRREEKKQCQLPLL
jgi:hypothetical protein